MNDKLRSFLQQFNAPAFPVVITLCLYLGFSFMHLGRHRFDPSFFVVAGDKFADSSKVPENLSVLKNSYGYDGQFYYRLAINPFSNKATDHGIRIDDPRYRGQRILYPLLAWTLSAGNVSMLPWILILINLTALAFVGWLAARYMQQLGRHALWALAFSLQLGFLTSLSRDLTEIVETVFIFTFLISLLQKNYLRAALFLCVAILAKETSLLLAVATSAALVWQVWFDRISFRKGMLWMLLPFALYFAWQIWLNHHWVAGLNDVLHNAIGFPLVNFFSYFLKNAALSDILQKKYFIEFCYLLVFTGTAAFCFFHSNAELAIKFSWLLYGCLVFSLSDAVWIADAAFLRAILEFYITGILLMLGSPKRFPRIVLALGCLGWIPLALFLIKYT